MRPALILAALPLFACLAACGENGGHADGPERRTAAGEVLGGEVSDAMLPLDTVRSTSPIAPRELEEGDPAGDGGEAADPTAAGEPAATAEPQPAETPSPAARPSE